MKAKDMHIFSRIAFCPHCFQNNSPSKGDRALIYHTTHQGLIVHQVSGSKGTRGFTPHLFMVEIPIPKDVTMIKIHSVCGICDVEIATEPNENGRFPYVVSHETLISLPRKEYIALWKKWKWTGLEID